MWRSVFASLAFFLAGSAFPAAHDSAIKKERQALQGTWKLVAAKTRGEHLGKYNLPYVRLIVHANGTATLKSIKPDMRAAFRVDPAKKPKSLDLVPLDGKDKGKTRHLIYKLEGGKLFILGSSLLGGSPGVQVEDRPRDFADDANHTLLVFAAQPTPEKEPVYSITIGARLPKLRFELPGVRAGDLLPMGKDTLTLGGDNYILFNGFPGQPGITLFALTRTWVVRAYAKAFKPDKEFLGGPELEEKFSNAAGVAGKFWIFRSEISGDENLDKLNPKEDLDAGLPPLKQVPKTFVFELPYKGKAVSVMMTGVPPDDVRPSVMAKKIAATFLWER
jgi:uncharacterized protein (TIGR03067 family)